MRTDREVCKEGTSNFGLITDFSIGRERKIAVGK